MNYKLLYNNDLYQEDVKYVATLNLPWHLLEDKNILLSGATGMIGSFLIDVILYKNRREQLNCTVFALGRDSSKAKNRFPLYFDNPQFVFINHDINAQIEKININSFAYVLHLASNTHPLQYANDPIGTIATNLFGLRNMLDCSLLYDASRFIFASSNEIYGENRGDVELFNENYCGYIDCNTLRAGYPESKRCGEALCQAYGAQKNLNFVIPRLTRTYGPTMSMSDTKVVSQFIKNAIANEDIVLKSTGDQFYSFQYVSDSVSGLLYSMLKGETGQAYNIADVTGDITLNELANIASGFVGSKVVFELPTTVESVGFSKATKARLNGDKIRKLGWTPKYNIQEGIERTITILREMET